MEEVGTYGTAGAVGGAGIGALVGGIGAVPGAVGGGIVGGIGGVISWLAGDGTAIKELSLKTATQYMTYVYGPAPFGGFGKFIEGLESSKEVLSYLDADYSKNVDAIKEDFDEVRQKNIDTLSAMQKASTISGKTFKGIRGMGADSQTGSPGQGPTGGRRGKSQLTLD